jgi:hypothetical protein
VRKLSDEFSLENLIECGVFKKSSHQNILKEFLHLSIIPQLGEINLIQQQKISKKKYIHKFSTKKKIKK